MQHLNPEELARLVDEEPTAEESLHLNRCGECSEELEEFRAQTSALGELSDYSAPPGQWERVERRLEQEGILPAPIRTSLRPRFAPLLAIAASLLLFLSGGFMGATVFDGASEAELVGATPPATVEQAEQRLVAAENIYLEALTNYAQLTGYDESTDPVNRLAALEGIVLTTGAALEEAPADPVINGYHLAALGQREALLRQIVDQPERTWF